MKGNKGSLLALALPLLFAIFACAGLMWNVSRFNQAQAKAQATADAVNLSVLRLRAASLEKIAERWEEFGRLLGPVISNGKVEAASSSVPDIQTKAQELMRAIPGYKGRLTSILKVAMEANRLSKDQHFVEDDSASALGITAMPFIVSDELGRDVQINGGWYRRDWMWEDVSRHQVEWQALLLRFPLLPSDQLRWFTGAESQARLAWDVSSSDPEFYRGNGGFPQQWNDAVEGNQVKPHRWPRFRAVLSP